MEVSKAQLQNQLISFQIQLDDLYSSFSQHQKSDRIKEIYNDFDHTAAQLRKQIQATVIALQNIQDKGQYQKIMNDLKRL